MIKTKELSTKDMSSRLFYLSKEFFKEYESYHNDYFKIKKLNQNNILNFFAKTINKKDNKTFIALDDNVIIGYITISIKKRDAFYKISKIGYISGLMIEDKYRNKGIGKMLLDEAKKWFKGKVKYFYLETSVNNSLGIEFYKYNKMRPLRVQYIGKV